MRITRLPLHDNACGRVGNLAHQCADNVKNIPPHSSMCQAFIYNKFIQGNWKRKLQVSKKLFFELLIIEIESFSVIFLLIFEFFLPFFI